MDSDTMDTSSDASHFLSRLCTLCSGITAAALASSDGYSHAPDLSVISDAQGSCSLCTQIWSQIQRPDSASWDALMMELGERPFRNVTLRAAAKSGASHLTREGHSLVVSFDFGPGNTQSQTLPELEVWCSAGRRPFSRPELMI
jgi:hypothetical protein